MMESFYISNPNFERRKPKSKSVFEKSPIVTNIKRTPTIDRELTEKIMGNIEIDNILNDPKLIKFIKK
jgi:hypothetical protein